MKTTDTFFQCQAGFTGFQCEAIDIIYHMLLKERHEALAELRKQGIIGCEAWPLTRQNLEHVLVILAVVSIKELAA